MRVFALTSTLGGGSRPACANVDGEEGEDRSRGRPLGRVRDGTTSVARIMTLFVRRSTASPVIGTGRTGGIRVPTGPAATVFLCVLGRLAWDLCVSLPIHRPAIAVPALTRATGSRCASVPFVLERSA